MGGNEDIACKTVHGLSRLSTPKNGNRKKLKIGYNMYFIMDSVYNKTIALRCSERRIGTRVAGGMNELRVTGGTRHY